jgi:non-ribosomal peptide synthetase-like protein
MRFLHRFATPLQILVTLGLFAELAVLYGLAAFPSFWGVLSFWRGSTGWDLWLRVLALSGLIFAGFFLFALALVLVVGLFRLLTFAGTPRGRFPYYSLKAFQWASYNALILAVRFTVMDFLRVTPFLPFFHRLMGMRVGKRVQINTKVIADSNLIEIGDDTVVGGDVTLVCHAAEAGDLVTAPVRIGKRVTIGLMAIIFPGCEIGDGAIIAANAVLPKGTKVPPNTIWAGIPARQVGERSPGRLSADP